LSFSDFVTYSVSFRCVKHVFLSSILVIVYEMYGNEDICKGALVKE